MRRARGQGLVEASLSLLVIVTVVILGIHLSEVMQVAAKAPQIAHAVLFDAAAHSVAGPPGLAPTVASLNTRFGYSAGDLDLRTSTQGGTRWKAVFTRTQTPQLISAPAQSRILRPPTCSYPPNDPLARKPTSLDSGWSVKSNPVFGVDAVQITTSFAEGAAGFFQAGHVLRTWYPICAVGKFTGGRCSATFEMLIDDRALHLEGPGLDWDRRDCALYGCSNTEYKDQGAAGFGAGSGAASAMARAVIGTSPINEDEFWMSFRDDNSSFSENGFLTGPGPANRNECFLGLRCP